jgi:hypothetical protein
MIVATEGPTTSEDNDDGKAMKTSLIRTPSVIGESAAVKAPMDPTCDRGHSEVLD